MMEISSDTFLKRALEDSGGEGGALSTWSNLRRGSSKGNPSWLLSGGSQAVPFSWMSDSHVLVV